MSCVQAMPVSRQLPAEAGGLDLGAKMWAAMEEVQRHGGGHGKVGAGKCSGRGEGTARWVLAHLNTQSTVG